MSPRLGEATSDPISRMTRLTRDLTGATQAIASSGHACGAGDTSPTTLHLRALEAESVHILREVAGQARSPVLLYSIGKDSSVLLHVAQKAFFPGRLPFPLLHIDTRWKFRDMIAFRSETARRFNLELRIHTNEEGLRRGVNPIDTDSVTYNQLMKTDALKQALAAGDYDFAVGGARRDEERSRAKERIFSVRSPGQVWDPKRQRPELWRLYNGQLAPNETMRVFPLSNWTERDVWSYIRIERISVVPLYFAALRPTVERQGRLIVVDDERLRPAAGEQVVHRRVRFRSLGCYPLSAAIPSDAETIDDIIREMRTTRLSERAGRLIDADQEASMERKKRDGYF